MVENTNTNGCQLFSRLKQTFSSPKMYESKSMAWNARCLLIFFSFFQKAYVKNT